MFEECISRESKTVLRKISNLVEVFYLAGGTGLALQIGHRLSEDLDFFSDSEFNTDRLYRALKEKGKVELILLEDDTLIARFEGVMLSFFYYEIPLLFPKVTFEGCYLASYKDISAEKLKTIAQRGKKKDFIDLYCVLNFQFLSIEQIISIFKRKFPEMNCYQVLKSLTYFEDAEGDPEVVSKEKLSWEEIKSYFISNISEFERYLTG